MNKGFVLLDALIGVFIVCSISTISINVFYNYKNYKDGFNRYREEVNDKYVDIFNGMEECERCVLEEEDLSRLEQ